MALRLLLTTVFCSALMACTVSSGLQTNPASEQAVSSPLPAAPAILAPPSSVGQWYELQESLAPWLAGDAAVPANIPPDAQVPTRVAVLQSPQSQQWLAVVIAQRGKGPARCQVLNSLKVNSYTTRRKDPDCLRMRRDADFDHWMRKQQSVLFDWLHDSGLDMKPRSWVAQRIVFDDQEVLEVHVLLSPALIEPVTRSNNAFLAAGEPGDLWALDFGRAVRRATTTRVVELPAFPFSTQVQDPDELARSRYQAITQDVPEAETAEQILPTTRPHSDEPRPPRADRR